MVRQRRALSPLVSCETRVEGVSCLGSEGTTDVTSNNVLFTATHYPGNKGLADIVTVLLEYEISSCKCSLPIVYWDAAEVQGCLCF